MSPCQLTFTPSVLYYCVHKSGDILHVCGKKKNLRKCFFMMVKCPTYDPGRLQFTAKYAVAETVASLRISQALRKEWVGLGDGCHKCIVTDARKFCPLSHPPLHKTLDRSPYSLAPLQRAAVLMMHTAGGSFVN